VTAYAPSLLEGWMGVEGLGNSKPDGMFLVSRGFAKYGLVKEAKPLLKGIQEFHEKRRDRARVLPIATRLWLLLGKLRHSMMRAVINVDPADRKVREVWIEQ
jgi:hypothetical protein